MWNNKVLKKQARKSINTTYKHAIAVAFLLALLSGTYASTATLLNTYIAQKTSTGHELVEPLHSSDTLHLLFGEYIDNHPDANPAQIVVMSTIDHVIDAVIPQNSLIMDMVKAINAHMGSRIAILCFFLLAGLFIKLLYKIFFANVLSVGACRFFLESRIYKNTRISKIFHVYNIRKLKEISTIVLMKDICQILWYLTIVGGVIKHYEYLMIPYLLAENPRLSREEAFTLSKKMMMGNKLHAFGLDMSFLGWTLLGIASFGILDIFYMNSYKAATHAELYISIRQHFLQETRPERIYFTDQYLTSHYMDEELEGCRLSPDEYPDFLSEFPPTERHMALNPQRKYALTSLILLFFTFSMGGWLWEFLLHVVKDHEIVKRGVMWGPWLPIYGFGGVLSIIFFRHTIRRPILNFFLIMFSFTTMEYFSGLFLEMTTGYLYWNYSSYILSYQGRIFLLASVFFAMGGCACLYYLGPKMDDIFRKWSPRFKIVLCIILMICFTIDFLLTLRQPHAGPHISTTTLQLPSLQGLFHP